MGWKERAVPAQAMSWKHRATPLEAEGPSALESGLRGLAEGATFGFEDELAGLGGMIGSKLGGLGVDEIRSPHPEAQARMDAIASADTKPLDEIYQEDRDDERAQNEAAEKSNPGTYLAGNVAGGIASPISQVGTGLKGALGLGGAIGLGGSKADLLKGEFGKAAKDTAIGAGGGALGYGMGKAIQGIPGATKKFLTNLGPSEEAIDAKLAGRAGSDALSYPELAEKMGDSLKRMKGQISDKSDEAAQLLSNQPGFSRDVVTAPIDQAMAKLKLHGKTLGQTDKGVESFLSGLKEDLSGLGDQLSEQDLKAVIRKLDDNINWDDQSRAKLNEALKGLRNHFDQSLKSGNVDYQSAMKPVSERMAVLDKIRDQFNFRHEAGKGLLPTDTTATKIQSSLRENKAVTRKNLEKLKEFVGDDFLSDAKNYQLAQQFEKTGPNGSRRTVLGGTIGSLLGTGLSPGLGTAAGGAVGAGVGATLDRYGGQAVGKLIDSYLAAGNTKAFGKFAPIIQKAAAQSPQSLSVVGALLSKNPEFRKTMGLDN